MLGRGGTGQIGNGTKAMAYTPTAPFGLGKAKSVCAGNGHSCAVLDDGTAACWGSNTYGQLGLGHNYSTLIPEKVKGLTGAIDVQCNERHTCFLKVSGEVWCAGHNNKGQLGIGSGSPSMTNEVLLVPDSKP